MSSECGCVRGVLKCLTDLWNWPLVCKVYVLSILVMSWFFLRVMTWCYLRYFFGELYLGEGRFIIDIGYDDFVFFYYVVSFLFLLCGFLLAVIFGSRISTRMAFLHPVISFGVAACVFFVLHVVVMSHVSSVVFNIFDIWDLLSPVVYTLVQINAPFSFSVVFFVLGRELGDGMNYVLARFLHRGGV